MRAQESIMSDVSVLSRVVTPPKIESSPGASAAAAAAAARLFLCIDVLMTVDGREEALVSL